MNLCRKQPYQLAEMQNPDAMGNRYTKRPARAQKKHIPTKLLQLKQMARMGG